MKLLFENWRKYLNEADTDGDGSLDPEELRKMAADLEGGEASEEDLDAARMMLQYEYNVPKEQIGAMLDKLKQLGGEAFRQAAEDGQLSGEVENLLGISPAPGHKRPWPKKGPGRSSDQIRAQAKSMARKGGYRDPYAGGYDIEGISEGEDK